MLVNNYLDDAIKKIQSGKLDIEYFIKEIDYLGYKVEVMNIIHRMLLDESHLNKLSILCGFIREFNDKESLPIIWELISRNETKGQRGSLVYAIENMNPIEYFEQLVGLIINDNYEVLLNSMNIIDRLEGYVDGTTLTDSISNIKVALGSPIEDWRKEALITLLEELEE